MKSFFARQPRKAAAAFLFLAAAVLLAVPVFSAAPQPATENRPAAAAPAEPNYTTTPEMSAETQLFSLILTREHLAKRPIKSVDGNAIIRDYISNLDYSHLFFTEPEIKGYQDRFAPLLDIYFERGNLSPAFTIYKDFYQRLGNRVEWIERRLEQPFDFDTCETFVADRRKLDWPRTAAEADQIWENRLKLDIILEVLSSEAKNNSEKSKTAPKKKTTAASESPAAPDAAPAAPPPAAATATPTAPDPKLLAEAIERVRKRYNKTKTYLKFEPYEVQEIYLNTLGSEYDPHTTFFSRQSREDFEISMRNKLIGIGAVLRDEDGYCTIKEIIAGGPVEGSKRIRIGDRIIAVGQGNAADADLTDVIGVRLNKIITQLRGKEGTIVRLRIEPAADRANRYVIALKRAEIKLTTKLATATLHQVPAPDGERTIPIGVIELPAFYGKDGDGDTFSTTDDVAELIKKLKEHKIEALILDLRRNGGGLLTEAIRLAGLFIPPDHPVVQVKNNNDKPEVGKTFDTPATPLWSGPLAMLVSKVSASASEIVVGALQDHKRAIIIGDPQTHGKGSVQTIFNYSRFSPHFGSAAKFTIQKWYLPSGNSIQLKGVNADIPAPSVYSVLPISEADLEHPLPWDSIPTALAAAPASYVPADALVTPELTARLRTASETRQRELPEFRNHNRVLDWTKSREKSRAYPVNYRLLREERESDRRLTAEVKETYASLSSLKYKSTLIKLAAAIEQERKEDLARKEREAADNTAANTSTPAATGSNDDPDNDDAADTETASTDFDVQTRETLRILADWLTVRADLCVRPAVPVASTAPSPPAAN